MATAKRKLFGILAVPDEATHVTIHRPTDAGKMTPKLRLQVGNDWFEHFPISELNKSWIAANFGPGVYRFAFLAIDKQGRKKVVPPSSGALTIGEPESVPANGAATPATAPAGGLGQVDALQLIATLAGKQQGGGIDAVSLVGLILQVQQSERQAQAAMYERQTARDREFYTTVMQLTRGRFDDDDDEPEEDDEGGDIAEKIATKVGEQIGPLTRMAKKYLEEGLPCRPWATFRTRAGAHGAWQSLPCSAGASSRR